MTLFFMTLICARNDRFANKRTNAKPTTTKKQHTKFYETKCTLFNSNNAKTHTGSYWLYHFKHTINSPFFFLLFFKYFMRTCNTTDCKTHRPQYGLHTHRNTETKIQRRTEFFSLFILSFFILFLISVIIYQYQPTVL